MTECYCDYGDVSFYHSDIRRSRKPHKCDECSATIKVGERYEHVIGKWEGVVGTYDTCDRCLSLREYVKAHVPCFCWYHGNVIEDAMETAQGYAHETVGLLFGAYRRRILIRRGQTP